ncbi:MAG: hypothetical protein ACRENE_09800, partial [Polyangiaceae bacterium]
MQGSTAVAPQTFLRFAAEYTDLLVAIFERREVDETELVSLIGRHRREGDPAVDHIQRQLQDLGCMQRAPHSDSVYELSRPVADMLAWLLKRQQLSSAEILRAYIDELSDVGNEIDRAIHDGDVNGAVLAVDDAERTAERVRSLSDGNRESILTEAQHLRSLGEATAVQRFQVVRRLWERYL